MGDFLERHWPLIAGGSFLLGVALVFGSRSETAGNPAAAKEPRSFRRGAWSFDHYPDGELRAYMTEPTVDERWAGDYSVGRFSKGGAERAASSWADHHRRTGDLLE